MRLFSLKIISASVFLVLCTHAIADHANACEELRKIIRTGSQHNDFETDIVGACVSSVEGDPGSAIALANYIIGYMRDDVAMAMIKAGFSTEILEDSFHFVVSRDNLVVVEHLLDKNTSLKDTLDGIGSTPLKAAAISGAFSTAKVLISRGADLNKSYPLLAAVQEGNLEIAYLLVDEGANLENPEGNIGPILAAAMQNTDSIFISYLLRYGYSPDQYNDDGHHVLLGAVHHRDVLTGETNWRFLVSRGANPQIAICQIPESQVTNLNNTPEWFRLQFEKYHPSCLKAEKSFETKD